MYGNSSTASKPFRMLSPVLLLKPQNTTTSLLFSKNSTGSKYLNEYNTKSYHSHTTHFNLPNPHTCVSCSPSNHLVQPDPHPLTLLRPSVTSSLKFSNSSIAVAVPPLWNKLPPALRQTADQSYALPQPSPLASSPQLFHSKLKTLLFSKSYPDPSSPPYLPPRLNSKHHPP